MTSESIQVNQSSADKFAGVDRRRARLPQPDFEFYKKANAYPGAGFFFVGHSFNLEESAAALSQRNQRLQAISALFATQELWIEVSIALENKVFSAVLSRFEYDLLNRLPESALLSPAIGPRGHLIPESFTIWRKEMRRR